MNMPALYALPTYPPSRCRCGDEAIWGSLATEADVAAWRGAHADCAPAPVGMTLVEELLQLGLGDVVEVTRGAALTLATADATRDAARQLRARGYLVGATERTLLVRRRGAPGGST